MIHAELSIFATSAGLLLFMPGPTNAVMMGSGAESGWRKSFPLIPDCPPRLSGRHDSVARACGSCEHPRREVLHNSQIAGRVRHDCGCYQALAQRRAEPLGIEESEQRQRLRADPLQSETLVISFGLIQPISDLANLFFKCATLGALVVLSAGCWIAAGAGTHSLTAISAHWITRTTSVVLSCFAVYFLICVISDIDDL
jgi:hypothetical protein